MSFYPQDGAVYRHISSGELYQVLMMARLESTQDLVVVYQHRHGTMPWVRLLSEFGDKFSYVSDVGWEPS